MAERRNQFTYPGSDVTVTWDRRLCIHVQACTRAKGEVFVKGRDPWGDPDRVAADEVMDVVCRCPTGALTAERADGGSVEQPEEQGTITVASRGPLYLRGDLRIQGVPDDMRGVAFRAALCRCGKTANAPFCDQSHEAAGFADQGPIGDCGAPLQETGGPLTVTPMPNGPVRVEGNIQMVSSDGSTVWTGTKLALCRCGESQNKPFCDGTHKQIGFTTE